MFPFTETTVLKHKTHQPDGSGGGLTPTARLKEILRHEPAIARIDEQTTQTARVKAKAPAD
jgi:hypothetical protein